MASTPPRGDGAEGPQQGAEEDVLDFFCRGEGTRRLRQQREAEMAETRSLIYALLARRRRARELLRPPPPPA